MRKFAFCLCSAALGVVSASNLSAQEKPVPAPLPDAPSTTANEAPPAVPTGPTVVFDTSMGRLTCKLFSKEAPETVANFIGLTQGTKAWTDPLTDKKVKGKPFFDGTTFHRVIPSFMIQGGDRLGTGMGDPGYFFADEFSPALRFDVPGRLAMANSGPNTNGAQFFITEEPVPQLTGKHTIFGQCDSHSVMLVAGIARVPRNADDNEQGDHRAGRSTTASAAGDPRKRSSTRRFAAESCTGERTPSAAVAVRALAQPHPNVCRYQMLLELGEEIYEHHCSIQNV